MSFLRTIRFIVIPIFSLVCTFFFPITSPYLWALWVVAFISVCEWDCSTWAMARPAFWAGLHILFALL